MSDRRWRRPGSSSAISFSSLTRSMTADIRVDISEMNPATAPRKKVGATACENMWVSLVMSGMNSMGFRSPLPNFRKLAIDVQRVLLRGELRQSSCCHRPGAVWHHGTAFQTCGLPSDYRPPDDCGRNLVGMVHLGPAGDAAR